MRKSIAVMRHCVSRSDFMSYQDVDNLTRELLSPGANAKRREERVKATEQLFVEKEPDLSFWSMELLEAIDTAAQVHISKVMIEIGMAEDSYLNALGAYTQQVIDEMQKLRPGHPLLDVAMARFKWKMTRFPGQPVPMPLVTEKVLEYICASLGQTRNAIEEVSSNNSS